MARRRPQVIGKPDSTMLNKGESYEIVYCIDRYMTDKGWILITTFHNVEAYLKSMFPKIDHKLTGGASLMQILNPQRSNKVANRETQILIIEGMFSIAVNFYILCGYILVEHIFGQ